MSAVSRIMLLRTPPPYVLHILQLLILALGCILFIPVLERLFLSVPLDDSSDESAVTDAESTGLSETDYDDM